MDPWVLVNVMAGFMATGAFGIASWALLQVVTLGKTTTRLEATMDALRSEQNRRFDEQYERLDEMLDWMKRIEEKVQSGKRN